MGAVGLTPVGGHLPQETQSCRSCVFLLEAGDETALHTDGYGQGLLGAAAGSERHQAQECAETPGDSQRPLPAGQGSSAVPGRALHPGCQA